MNKIRNVGIYMIMISFFTLEAMEGRMPFGGDRAPFLEPIPEEEKQEMANNDPMLQDGNNRWRQQIIQLEQDAQMIALFRNGRVMAVRLEDFSIVLYDLCENNRLIRTIVNNDVGESLVERYGESIAEELTHDEQNFVFYQGFKPVDKFAINFWYKLIRISPDKSHVAHIVINNNTLEVIEVSQFQATGLEAISAGLFACYAQDTEKLFFKKQRELEANQELNDYQERTIDQQWQEIAFLRENVQKEQEEKERIEKLGADRIEQLVVECDRLRQQLGENNGELIRERRRSVDYNRQRALLERVAFIEFVCMGMFSSLLAYKIFPQFKLFINRFIDKFFVKKIKQDNAVNIIKA